MLSKIPEGRNFHHCFGKKGKTSQLDVFFDELGAEWQFTGELFRYVQVIFRFKMVLKLLI